MEELLTNSKRLEIFTTTCAFMVLQAQQVENNDRSIKDWRAIYETTLRVMTDLKAHPPLDEIESLAASIIIVGSEYQSLFIVAFHLLLPWQRIRGWFWIIALELIRHHAILSMSSLYGHDTVVCDNFVKELSTVMDLVPSIPDRQKELLLEDVRFLQENNFKKEFLTGYARKYPLEKFSSWAVDKLQRKLEETTAALKLNHRQKTRKALSTENDDNTSNQLSSPIPQVAAHATDNYYTENEIHFINISDSNNSNRQRVRKVRIRGNAKRLEEWPPMCPLQGDSYWTHDSDHKNDIETDKENIVPPNVTMKEAAPDHTQESLSIWKTNRMRKEAEQHHSSPPSDQAVVYPNKKRLIIETYGLQEHYLPNSGQEYAEEPGKRLRIETNNENHSGMDEDFLSDITVCSEDRQVQYHLLKDDQGMKMSFSDAADDEASIIPEDASLVSRLQMAVWKVFSID